MNKNHVYEERVVELISQLGEEHIKQLERYAEKRMQRHIGFRQRCTHLHSARDLVHTGLVLMLPVNGPARRKARSEDLEGISSFLKFLQQTIWSIISNEAGRHEQKFTVRDNDWIETRAAASSLQPQESEEVIRHIEAQLLLWADNSKVRRRAVKRFLRVVAGGAIPKHNGFQQVQQVARDIYLDL